MSDTYRNILVAVDGSEQSEKAFDEAVKIAKRSEGFISVISVVDTSLFGSSAPEFSNAAKYIERQVEENLEQLHEKLKQDDRKMAESMNIKTLVGNPKREIIEYAKQNGIDLIVMGATGKGAIDRLLVGSTTAYVVNHAPCNVLVVK